MPGSSSSTPQPLGLLFLLLAVGLIGLLGMMATFAWMASSWDMGGMMGSDHMSTMMGGGGRNSSGDPSQQGDATATVIIEDFAYSPGNLQVPRGARVTWTNRDSAPHSATDTGGTWDTGVLAKGKSGTLTFESAGTFDYFCSVHPNMKARLVVQ
jgi:plastocyanin